MPFREEPKGSGLPVFRPRVWDLFGKATIGKREEWI